MKLDEALQKLSEKAKEMENKTSGPVGASASGTAGLEFGDFEEILNLLKVVFPQYSVIIDLVIRVLQFIT